MKSTQKLIFENDISEIQLIESIDDELARWYCKDIDGNVRAPVCCVCDRFVKPSNKCTISKEQLEKNILC